MEELSPAPHGTARQEEGRTQTVFFLLPGMNRRGVQKQKRKNTDDNPKTSRGKKGKNTKTNVSEVSGPEEPPPICTVLSGFNRRGRRHVGAGIPERKKKAKRNDLRNLVKSPQLQMY